MTAPGRLGDDAVRFDIEPFDGEVFEGEAIVAAEWVDVCAFDDLEPDRGVAALVGDVPVAVFRCWPDDSLHAVANIDPYTGASVIARGVVGSVGDRPVVASPLGKQRFDLRTGEAVDDGAAVRLPVHAVRVEDGRVLISRVPRPA
ncbi:MAG: nitrite reductase small subunit NirD [Actinobacteria bacterium]|nr:nitrite reductase small subunit NirD [Actinomycetota bacterium]